MQTYLLRGFGLLGVILFLPLFLLTFSDPHSIEQTAKGFIEWKLKQETHEKIDAITLPKSEAIEKFLGDKAKTLHQKATTELTAYKQMLKENAPAIMAEQLVKLRNLDCECRKIWEERYKLAIRFNIASLEEAKTQLKTFMQMTYMQIVHELTLDVRIFLGVNTFIFLFLLLASFFKPEASPQLFIPAILLIISTIICSYFYLFEQNWLFTIIYNDYTGFGYLAYLSVVFFFLCDVTLNKARVLGTLLNAISPGGGPSC